MATPDILKQPADRADSLGVQYYPEGTSVMEALAIDLDVMERAVSLVLNAEPTDHQV